MADDRTDDSGQDAIKRRDFLRGIAASGVGAAAVAATPGPADAQQSAQAPATTPGAQGPVAAPDVLTFFTPAETVLIEAIANRFVPADALSPSGVELGLVAFLDRQLGGAYGQGAKTYRSGPWAAGTPNQGYQLPFPPAELYRQGLAELAAVIEIATPGRAFESKPPAEQDALLSALETGALTLPSVPAKLFFETLRTNLIEGLFCDPAYGGNRGMKGWAMIGFPGVQLDWTEGFTEWRNKRVDLAPQSIADNL
jgi:gluconate 2-dehydrogenase gamma chain